MTRNARRAIVSLVMAVTTVLSILVTIPIAQRYAQARVQEVTANHKGTPGEMAVSVMNNSIYPSLAAIFGSFILGALAGVVVGKMLPRLGGIGESPPVILLRNANVR